MGSSFPILLSGVHFPNFQKYNCSVNSHGAPLKKVSVLNSSSHYISALPLFCGFLALAFLLSACSTPAPTGVRKEFQDHRIETIAIVPFYSRTSFGIEREHLREVREIYEASATIALRAEGFSIVDPRGFREYLEEAQLLQVFEESISLRGALTGYFESPLPGAPTPFEVTALQLLHQESFPFDTLLFGEIVYQTEGTCRVSASNYSRYAQTRSLPGAPSSFPRPCVVSHFRAKLVDVRTGQTMWFNQTLLETYARQIDRELRIENIRAVIEATFRDQSHGPRKLGGAQSQFSLEPSASPASDLDSTQGLNR